jgi:DNA-binding XRE family transcriptional regulator
MSAKQLAMAKYSNDLKKYMLSGHFTEQDLAYATGKHQSTISRYVNGSAVPDVITASRLARLFGVKIEDIWRQK